jgi:RNA polymerase sigma factor (sigma-70 family)
MGESPEALVNLLVRERVLAVKKKDVMDVTPLSDSELALALKGGDEGAFEELVRRHQGRVYAVAYRLTGNREDALDIAQESFVKAYRKIHAWQPHGGFLAWLLRLTTNQAIDTLRRRKRQRHDRLADDRHGEEGDRYVVVSTAADSAREVWAHEIGERLELSREEVGSLSRLKVGEAVLVLPDQQHLPLRVLVPPPWMPAYETDMASMQRNLAGAMEVAVGVSGGR